MLIFMYITAINKYNSETIRKGLIINKVTKHYVSSLICDFIRRTIKKLRAENFLKVLDYSDKLGSKHVNDSQ